MADRCRCHLPVDVPLDIQHWWPERDPEPGMRVRAVALYGQEPAFLHRVRVKGGWHTRGLGANHPGSTPPKSWEEVGQCWAGEKHAVVDVTSCGS